MRLLPVIALLLALLLALHRHQQTRHCGSLQYGIIIDAGSTGSRIHIYTFAVEPLQLLDEVFELVKPGLSAFAIDEQAAASLDPLLDLAVHKVPLVCHSTTPMLVRATAGLRLLPGARADGILTAVERRLRSHFNFQLDDLGAEPVAILDGKDEAWFAWLTVNYLLRRFHAPVKHATVGIVELGGGSAQVVFEDHSEEPPCSREQCESYFQRKRIGPHEYRVYQQSHLGYGLIEARKRLQEVLVQQVESQEDITELKLSFGARVNMNSGVHSSTGDASSETDVLVIEHPCFAHGSMHELHRVSTRWRRIVFTGMSRHTMESDCSEVVRHAFQMTTDCEHGPDSCTFEGRFQPPISSEVASVSDDMSTAEKGIFASSFFFEKTRLILQREQTILEDISAVWTLKDVHALTKSVCAVSSLQRDIEQHYRELSPSLSGLFTSALEFHEHLHGRIHASGSEESTLCLDLNYIHHLMKGLGLMEHHAIIMEKKIDGFELGWCLGALIHILENL